MDHPLRLSIALAIALFAAAAVAGQVTNPETEDEPAPKTLYERLGGVYVLSAVADEFVEGLYTDPVVNARPAVKKALKRSRKAGLKFQTTSLLCQETGGPCKYDGRTMREGHRDLAITEREWKAAAAVFKRALATAHVPPAEGQELLNLLDTTKGDIVLTPAK